MKRRRTQWLSRKELVELLSFVVCPYCGSGIDHAALRDALLFGEPGDFTKIVDEWRTRAGNNS